MFAVVDHFLQLGSIDIMKHTMPIAPAKLVSEGPESLISQQCSRQQSSDGALPTSSESNTSGDGGELADESEKAGGDAGVHAETVLEELVKTEEDASAALASTVTEVIKPESEDVGNVVADEQLSGAGDRSDLDVQDVAATCSDRAVNDAQNETQSDTTVMSADTAVNQDHSEGNEMEKLNHDEERRTDNEPVPSSHTDQSDAAVQNTDDDGDSAARSSEVDHITDHTSVNDQTLAADHTSVDDQTVAADHTSIDDQPLAADHTSIDGQTVAADHTSIDQTLAADHTSIDDQPLAADHTSIDDQRLAADHIMPEQSAIVEQSTDIDMSAAVDSDTNKLAEEAVTVLVSNIPRRMDETVEMYLESKKKGGGKLVSFDYNERRGSALVVFADNAGNFDFCLFSAHVITSHL